MLTERESNLIETFRKRAIPHSELMAERNLARRNGRVDYEDALMALIDERFGAHDTLQHSGDSQRNANQSSGMTKEVVAPNVSRNTGYLSAGRKIHDLDGLDLIEKIFKPVSESNEYFYILSNESMPGLVKIGKTKTNPMQRKIELQSTGVPTPFEIEFSARVLDCNYAEKMAHRALSQYRISKSREFFRISVTDALVHCLPAIGEFSVASCAHPNDFIEAEQALVRSAENEKVWREENRKKAIQENLRRVKREVSIYKANCEPILAELLAEQRELESLGLRPKKDASTYIFPVLSGAFGIFGGVFTVFFIWSLGSKISTINTLALALFGFINAWLFEKIDPKRYSKSIKPFLALDQQISKLNKQIDEHKTTLWRRIPTNYFENYSLEELLRFADSISSD